MNWDAIGAIAELLGAIGVISSLVYLATQIRQSREQMSQNTRAMRASAYQEAMIQRDSVNLALLHDSELADLCTRGTANLDGLTEAERPRFEIWIHTLLRSSDNIHYQYCAGFVEEDRWQQQLATLRQVVSFPGVRAWWTTSPFQRSFSTQFVALVDEILAEEPDRRE